MAEPNNNHDKEEKLIQALRDKLQESRRRSTTGDIVLKIETARGGIVKSFVGMTEAIY